MNSLEIVLVLDSIRSLHNVGSLLRVADGLGVKKVYTTGTTPHPKQDKDSRLPHVVKRAEQQIHKTALGAENFVDCVHIKSVDSLLSILNQQGFKIVALELDSRAIPLTDYELPQGAKKVALVLGHELEGIQSTLLDAADQICKIPMLGAKNSLNVATAGAIALFQLRNLSTDR